MLFPANLHESLIVLPLDWNTWYVSRSSRNRFNLHGKKSASLGTNILLLGVLCTLTSVTSSFHTHSSLQSSLLGFFLALLDGVGLRNMSLDTLVWATSPPAKTMRRRFGSLFSVGYGSSLMSGAPLGVVPLEGYPNLNSPMNNSKKRVDHPSCAKRRCMNGCRLVSNGLVAKQLISSNSQFRVFLDVDLTRWHRYGRPWSFLWRRGSRWDLPGTPCSSSCWFAISGLMVLETSSFYPLIKTVLLLNRVSSILYFNPLAMGQYPSAS